MRSFFAAALLAAAGALACVPAQAFDNIKFMIGANPGGGYDQTGRGLGAALIASGAAKTTSYENKPGAGGTIGLAQFVNSERGNANALLVTGAVMVGAIETNKPPITLKDATPIASLFGDALILVVPANSKMQSIKDVIAQLKTNPGSVTWGGGSRGSVDHILVGLIAREAGVDPAKINYIPFAGGGEAAAAILGGQVTVGISGFSEFESHVKSGRMRALAISADQRVDEEKKIPTLREQDVRLVLFNWRGVYAAPGISEAQRKQLIDAVVKATSHPSWQETLKKNNWTPLLLTGDEFAQYVGAESARIGGLLKSLGIAK